MNEMEMYDKKNQLDFGTWNEEIKSLKHKSY